MSKRRTAITAHTYSKLLFFFLDSVLARRRPCAIQSPTERNSVTLEVSPIHSATTAYTAVSTSQYSTFWSSTNSTVAEHPTWQNTSLTVAQVSTPYMVSALNSSTLSGGDVSETVSEDLSTSPFAPSAVSLSKQSAATLVQRPGLGEGCLPTSLANADQTGGSWLGLLSQPVYPKWLDNGRGVPYLTPPWGNASVFNTDATILRNIPESNITRRYSFTISRSRISPDGVLRDVILINNQFPGPVIEANWGDWIEVTITNRIANPPEGTSMHWHGLLQRKTPWQDGVPGVGQCPLAPDQSLTYRFQAEVYGTSWYHAHYSSQYTAGIAGPIVIYGPSSLDYDLDLGPVMLTDWNHIPYFSMVANAVGSNLSVVPPRSDNNLINGRGTYDCSVPSYSNGSNLLGSNLQSDLIWTCVNNSQTSKFYFTAGKTHRLRLVNHGADGIQKFSIDGHNMTVIATDFVPIVPYETQLVTLAVGQRTDVLVTANQSANSSWWMRTQTPGWPLCGGAVNAEGRAAIFYEGAETCIEPSSNSSLRSNLICANDPLQQTRPAAVVKPDPETFIQDIVISIRINETRQAEWCINNETFRTNFNDPVLFRAADGQTNFSDTPEWGVYNFDRNRSVILNVSNETPFAHPFHLHGHSFFILADGVGLWNGSVVLPENPMRRDVQIVQGSGYVAAQIDLDNPGVWPFHCHVAWHLSGGLNMNILSHPDDIPNSPATMMQTCVDWQAWTKNNVVDQIDSGA